MNVAAYVRVSTDRQADEGYSIPQQTERVTAYCKAKDWNLVKIYTDPGFSGKDTNRPALQKLIKELDSYDIVLVNKLDRLSRSQMDTLHLVENVFPSHGVSFVSMEESFDTTTAIGITMVGILSSFAQYERSQIKERTKMGKEARKKQGLWHGGCNIPIGYDYTDGMLIPNDEAPQVQLIFDMYLKGEKIRDICRYLSEHYTTRYTSWNYVGTVRRILGNNVYIGMVGEYKGQHEPLIDKEVFDSVQIMLEEHKTGKKSGCTKHLLTGMIYCGECGNRVRACASVTKKARYSYYRCGRADSSGLNLLDHKCALKPQKEDEVNKLVINEILKLKLENIKIEPKTKPVFDNTKEIELIDRKIERIMNLYANVGGDIEAATKQIKELKAKKKALEKVNIRPIKATKTQIRNTLSIAKETFENGDMKNKIMVVNALINKVTLYNDSIKIEWKF